MAGSEQELSVPDGKKVSRRSLLKQSLCWPVPLAASAPLALSAVLPEGRGTKSGLAAGESSVDASRTPFRLSTFSVDVTCPLGHPLIAGLRQPAKKIVDPLFARGFVLQGAGQPIVLCAIDWCEIRNRSYDRWREVLADAVQTTRNRVLVTSIHQHDAPVTDIGAAELLQQAGLGGAMFDPDFERRCIARTARAVKESLASAVPLTHLGTGQARVERIASNRRVVLPDGSVTYGRGSNSGGNPLYRNAPEGLIDPYLRMLVFYSGEKAVAALSSYATHPMSYYGRGGVSADFVGMARQLMQREYPEVLQIYTSGCSGDVTAGKYNDGSPQNRPVLAKRLFTAMQQAWKRVRRQPLQHIDFRSTLLDLPFRTGEAYTKKGLQRTLHNPNVSRGNRILAAMGLSSRLRVEKGEKIDFPCVDFGFTQLVLFPGEAFVEYQLLARKQRPDSFVVSLGYGECWPGYIPSPQGFRDNFRDKWLWVAPGADRQILTGLQRLLPGK